MLGFSSPFRLRVNRMKVVDKTWPRSDEQISVDEVIINDYEF